MAPFADIYIFRLNWKHSARSKNITSITLWKIIPMKMLILSSKHLYKKYSFIIAIPSYINYKVIYSFATTSNCHNLLFNNIY